MYPSTSVNHFWSARRRSMAVVAIVFIAAALRLIQLRSVPAWYNDECIYVQQVWNLMQGRFAWDNVAHSFLPRLPFMHFLIMPLFAMFGRDVVWIRLVAALSGVGTVWLVYRIARESGGRSQAILAALICAAMPYTVLINRWGFSYNLDCFLGAANLYFLQRFCRESGKSRYLYWAAIVAGLGAVADPVMLGRIVLLVAVVVLLKRSLHGIVAMAITALPLAAYILFMLTFHRALFLEDARVILGQRIMESNPLLLAESFWQYMTENGPWLALGVIGLFLLPAKLGSRVLLWSFVFDLAFLLKSSGPDASILFRTGIILSPQLAVGAGFALVGAWRRAEEMIGREFSFLQQPSVRRALAQFARLGMAALLAGLLFVPSIDGISGNFRYNYNEACIFSIDDADKLAAWLNARVKPDDLVISTHINWMLNCQTTSPMIVDLVKYGQQSPIYFDGLRHRTLRELSLDKARYAVIHEAIPGMMKHYHFNKTYQEITGSWRMIHIEGLFRVFENPAL